VYGPALNDVDMTPVDGAREHVDNDKVCVKTLYPMVPDSNLEMLMARYQEGDFAAATALIDRLSPQLHRFFLAQFASRADADDLLQETWLRIHKVRHTYRPSEPMLPWFYAIARRVRVDHYRKAIRTTAREHRLEEMSEVAAAIPGESDRTDDLEALLAPLPQSQREVIEMLKVAGMSLEEVARATSSSVGSVKQKVHRAYEKLRGKMSAMGLSKGRSGGLS
jgi:RNA polymerase sigma-70 factor, ECF subfamily